MDILEILTDFASSLPSNSQINEKIKNQPESIRKAFELKDHNMLKACITNQDYYANEVRVTTY